MKGWLARCALFLGAAVCLIGIPLAAGAQTGVRLEPYEQIVADYAGLKAALEDAATTVVYLGGDITMQGGIAVNANKSSLVIDGISPEGPDGVRHTLVDYNSSAQDQTMYISRDGALKSVTLQNVILIGKNHFGPLSVSEANRGLEIAYRNVDYTGPQMTYNRYGTATYADCDIRIGQYGFASAPGEVGEVGGVVLEGRVSIVQEENQVNEIFYFEAMDGDIDVMPEAIGSVEAFGPSGFVYLAGGRTVRMTVWDGAQFSFSGPEQFWENQALSGLTVKAGGSFLVDITRGPVRSILRLEGDLSVEQDAVFHLTTQGQSAYGALYMNRGNAVFDSPRSVLLYTPRYRSIQFGSAGELHITAGQVNYWTAAGDGGLSDVPDYAWMQADGTDLTVYGGVSGGDGGNFTSLSSNYAPETADAPALNAQTFHLQYSRVLAFGRPELDVYALFQGDDRFAVYGETQPAGFGEAGAGYLETDGGDAVYVELGRVPVEAGAFTIAAEKEMREALELLIRVRVAYLYTEVSVTLQERGLYLEAADLEFGTVAVPSSQRLLAPNNENALVRVTDTRGAGSAWTLLGRQEGAFTSEEGYPELDGELVFVSGGAVFSLLDGEQVLFSGTSAASEEETAVQWPQGEGLFLRLRPGGVYAGDSYRAQFIWTLMDTP
ncbi:MAG: hypothetical protein LIO46_04440 [Clostridiales bacterium]|nr:hypothetical protein [Clostridiales bacterium]